MANGQLARSLLFAYLAAVGVFTGAGQRNCSDPLGLEDGSILDAQLSSPSWFNDNRTAFGPQRARLNHLGGYRAKLCNNCQTYIAVVLLKPYIITGIATQGYGITGVNEWTKQFWLGYSEGLTTSFFKASTETVKAQVFTANVDGNTVVRTNILVPAKVTSIQLMPIQWERNFAIRIELYGCVADGYECISTPCQNNGTCIDQVASYRCNCTAGFNGINCQYNIDDCASTPCLNKGTCIDLVNDFSCNCSAGFTGRNCSIDIDECISNPCLHGSTCIDGIHGYNCSCTPGYNGTHCELDVDECVNHQCQHNSTCIDGINDYSCNCTAGYTGRRCETDIDECLSYPCMHGGTCTDAVNAYSCNCTTGFGGPRCEEELAFFLAVWLQLDLERIDVQYFNESSVFYKSKATAVKREVFQIVVQEYGFFYAEIRKFSPVGNDGVAVEVLISCLKNSTSRILRVIHDNIINSQSIFAFNYFRSENKAMTDCRPPKIALPLPDNRLTPLKVGRSLDFTVDIDVDLNCTGSPPGSYQVDVYRIDKSTGRLLRSRNTKGVLASSLEYIIPARTLSYGMYYIKITAEIDRMQGTSTNAFGFIEVTISPLVANITGSELAYQGAGELVRLDRSTSYDPDTGRGNYTGMEFIWLCKRDNETFPSNISSLPVVKPTDSPQATDHGGCYGTGVGRLEPSPTASYLVQLDIDRMRGNVDYVIALVVRKDTRSQSAYNKIRVIEEIDISLICIQNCKHHMIPSARLIVETRCVGLLCDKIYSYEWSLYRYDSATHRWKATPNLDTNVLTYMNSPNLVTKESALLGNTSYALGVIARAPNKVVDTANYRFITNTPPTGGTCNVDLKEGQAWETVFHFDCSGWHDEDLPLTYRFRYNTSDGVEMVFSSGSSNAPMARLPVGDKRNDFNLDIQALITDSLGSAAVVKMRVKVIEPEMSAQLLEEAVGKDGEMNNYLRDNNIELAAQRATSVLSVVNHSPVKQMTLKQKVKIKESIVDAWAPVMDNVTKMQELSQVAAVVAGVTDKQHELSMDSQEKTVALLVSMTSFFSKEVANKSSDDKEFVIQEAGSGLLHGMGNMVWMTSEQAARNPAEEDLPQADSIQEKSKKLVEKTLQLVDQVGKSLSETKELYEKPSVIRTRTLSVVIDRQKPSLIGGKSLEDQGMKVTLPPTEELLLNKSDQNAAFLSTQMISLKTNPYGWDASSAYIKSSVLDFKIRNANGSDIEVNNLKKNIDLFIPPLKVQPLTKPRSYFAQPSNNGSMQYHIVSIPGIEYAVSIRVKPEKAANLTLYVRYHQRPTVFEYNYTAKVPDYGYCNFTAAEGYVNCSSDPYTVTISSSTTGHTGLHYIGILYEKPDSTPKVTKDNVTSHNNHSRVRRDCFTGSGRQRRALCVGVKEPPTTLPPVYKVIPKFDGERDVNYTMEVSMATCLYWNPGQQKWTSHGCKVGPRARPEALHCQCTHLSSFGGDFFVAPNPIDFDVVFRRFEEFDVKNFVVFFVVFGILGLYLIALVFAVRADRKDLAKATENLRLASPSNENCYEISIYTGMWRNNGTTANIAAIVYGHDGESDVLPLTDMYSKRRLYARASVNTFTVAIPEDIGAITKLKIWHDNNGDNPSWYLHQVVISHLESNSKAFFICNRWLAVDKEDGELEAEFPVATKKELSGFKYQFYSRLSKSLGDGHLWMSLVTRPPHSPFTRAQRLSCCLSVLYCAMVASAMFYQFGEKPTSTDAIKIGNLRLSLRQLIIGLQSAMLVVPVNLLIVTIFRNVKAAKSSYSYSPNESNPAKSIKHKTPGCLPHCFVYLGWFLCVSSVLAAGAFTIFYSLSWGGELANEWLTSVLISVIQDIGVTQPVKVVTFAVLLALILKKPVEEKTAKSGVKSELEINKNQSIIPPKGEKLEEARAYRQNVLETVKAVGEIVLYLLFVLCLLVFVYANRGYERYRLTKSIDDIFTSSFNEITKVEDFWKWSRSTLVPGLYDTRWYAAGGAVLPEGYISNKESFLVGMPRFRQLRMKSVSPCSAPKHFKTLASYFHGCIPPYEAQLEDRTPYSFPKWIPVTNLSFYGPLFNLQRLCPKPWRYLSSREIKSLPFHGKLANYDGGGYVADLGYNSRTALSVITDLKSNHWIDRQTAALFVEFTVFEPSTALFSHAKYLYETHPVTGCPLLHRDIETLSLYASPDPGFRKFFNAIQIIILFLIFCYLIIEVGKMLSLKCTYFKSFWNWMNMVQLFAAIATVVLFFFKEDYVSRFVKNVHANPYETTSMDYVILFADLELYVLSIVVFIVTIKFLRLLRFNRHICQMTASMKHSSGSIMTYTFVFLIDMVSFAFLAILVLGITMENYSDFVEALSSLFQKFLGGEFNFYEIQSANRIIGPIFLFTYMLSMMFILINMFVAILNDSYDSVRHMSGGKFPDTELGQFIRKYYNEKFRATFEILKRQFGRLGYRHRRFNPRKTHKKDLKKEEILGNYSSFPSDFMSFLNIAYQADNDHDQPIAIAASMNTESDVFFTDESETGTVFVTDESETGTTASVATESSTPELLDLLSDLPESIVDDEDTIENVRSKLSDMGAVLRLSKRSYRRFSTSGDKFVVQREFKLAPTVQLLFTPILDERKVLLNTDDT